MSALSPITEREGITLQKSWPGYSRLSSDLIMRSFKSEIMFFLYHRADGSPHLLLDESRDDIRCDIWSIFNEKKMCKSIDFCITAELGNISVNGFCALRRRRMSRWCAWSPRNVRLFKYYTLNSHLFKLSGEDELTASNPSCQDFLMNPMKV